MKLLLVFTYNTSLKIWDEQGILIRELKLYKKLIKDHGYKITLLTYGNNSDIEILKNNSLDKYFDIIPVYSITKKAKFKILNILKSLYLPIYLHKKNYKFDIVKTNQLYGAWVAIIFKIISRSKLIVRTGFNPVEFSKFQNKPTIKIFLFWMLSKFAIIFSNIYVTTNENDLDTITNRKKYKNKLIVQPNFVNINSNTSSKPLEERIDKTLLSIGRLESQKNHTDLINKLSNADYKLKIIGEGSLKEELIELSNLNKVKIELLDYLDHEILSKTYSEYLFYIQLSRYEGNPKTILEAMFSGCIVITSNVYGINNLVKDGVNGIILNNTQDLPLLIDKLLKDFKNLKLISNNAKNFVEENHSFERFLKTELEIHQKLNIIN